MRENFLYMYIMYILYKMWLIQMKRVRWKRFLILAEPIAIFIYLSKFNENQSKQMNNNFWQCNYVGVYLENTEVTGFISLKVLSLSIIHSIRHWIIFGTQSEKKRMEFFNLSIPIFYIPAVNGPQTNTDSIAISGNSRNKEIVLLPSFLQIQLNCNIHVNSPK